MGTRGREQHDQDGPAEDSGTKRRSMRRGLLLLHPPGLVERDIPGMARPSFRNEWAYYLLLGGAVGAIEGNLVAQIANKTFGAPDWLTALIWGIPISANLFNLVWGVVLRGRPVVPAMLLMTSVLALAVVSIGMANPAYGSWTAGLFAAQVALVHLMMSGLLTLRVTTWRANYPDSIRARITSRLQTMRMLMLLLTTLGLSWAFDHDPDAYRYLYPLLGLVGLVSLWPAARLRIRREGRDLEALADLHAGPKGLWQGIRESIGILRSDAIFGRYMLGQFLMGSANFLTDPVLLMILIGTLDFGYSDTTRMMFTLPTIMVLVSIHSWAGYFDRVGVVQFRVWNSVLWIATYALTIGAVLLTLQATTSPGAVWGVMGLLIAARVINGYCKGGGNLAWSLGHLHFADPERASLYMGIHVALTGLRGLIMPVLGVWLYGQLDAPYFLIPLGLSIAAFLVFYGLARRERAAESLRSEKV